MGNTGDHRCSCKTRLSHPGDLEWTIQAIIDAQVRKVFSLRKHRMGNPGDHRCSGKTRLFHSGDLEWAIQAIIDAHVRHDFLTQGT